MKFSSRIGLSRLNGIVPEVPRVLRICKFPRQSSFRTLKPQLDMEQLATPPATPKAGPPQGLGEILKDGYELTEHVVVDENHVFEGNNDVIEKLITGFKTFKEGVFKQKPELYDKLSVGQEPKMMMITCADSRVCPTMLHGLEAGEAFIVRNVANLVPPCEGSGQHHGTSAAIEYAVTVLNVENIIVMGHSSCGGIKALMSRDDFSGDFIGSWVKIGMPAKKKTLSLLGDKPFKEQCSFCEQETVNLSLANLLTFPFIQERLHSGRLQIYGMHYDFVEGRLTSWRIAQTQKLGVHN